MFELTHPMLNYDYEFCQAMQGSSAKSEVENQ
jgi:hypothetical protein